MTMWQSGMGSHGGKNNAWMKLMGIVPQGEEVPRLRACLNRSHLKSVK
nr:unnamed protein product [Callosobruchus analis]